jgi:hypothetical protein
MIIPETQSFWPAGHRGAVAIVVAVEGPVPSAVQGTPDVGVDYAATGLHRLLELLEDFDIGVTTSWSESALNSLPQLLRRVADQGHEVAATFGSSDVVTAESPLVGALRRVSGQPVTGAVSWGDGGDTASTGFSWQINGAGGDLPIVVGGTAEQPAVVQIPTSPYWIDRTWLHPERPQPPSSLLEAWSSSLAAIRTDGSLMTIVIHPHIMLRPGFSGTFTRFLDEIIASGDVWLTKLDLLATWWTQRQLGT